MTRVLSYLCILFFVSLNTKVLSQPIYSGGQSSSGSQPPYNFSYDLNISQTIDFTFCFEDTVNYTYLNLPFTNQGIEVIHEILFTVFNSSNQVICQHFWSGLLLSGATSNITIGPIPYMLGMQTFRVISQNTIIGENDQNPNNDTAVINAERYPRVIVNSLPDLNLCPNVNSPISAMSGFLLYQWSTGGNQNIEYISDSGLYSVTYTDYYGCTAADTFSISRYPANESIISSQVFFCENDSVQELALGGFVQYSWSNGNNQQMAVFTQSGVYTITVLDSNDCETIDTISVNKVQLPILELDSVYNFCENDSVTISPISNANSLIWDGISSGSTKNYSSPGTHVVSGIGVYNCIVHKTFEVRKNTLPSPNLGNDSILCEGENKQLFSGAFSQYLWNTGSNNQIITVNQPGLYSVTVLDTNGCSNSSEITLSLLSISISQLNDTILCDGDAFNVNPTGNFDSYQWNDGQTIGLNRFISQPGIYTLSTSLGGKCYKTVRFEVTGKTTPISDFSYVSYGNTVQFYNLSTLYDSLNWSFGDNSNSSNSDPTHIYQTDGVYSVRLSTNNVCGYSFVEKEITVNSLNTNNNHFTESSIFIYPNPAKNKLYVKSKLNQVLIIDIIDMVGKLQMEKRIIGSSNEIEINVEQLSKGMYIISIRDDFEVISNQKIVIE